MKVLQVLPELNSGGVERGTLEIARALVAAGHEALVVSSGGRLVPGLEQLGAKHIAMPVHKKRLSSLLQVRPFRRLLEREHPDILHIRSRVPGWIAWLAWRKLAPATRPHLVSTVHGFYSVNAYSRIMTRGERVIAVSNSVRDYILKNYPDVPAERITVIHRGVDPRQFPRGYRPPADWLTRWQNEHPEFTNKKLLLLPGRITRWKGQEDFIRLIAQLSTEGIPVHGLIAGETHPQKQAYAEELQHLAKQLGVIDRVTFLGHRSDVREVMAVSDLVLSLSSDPEAFGRVSLESASLGRPVAGYDHGGVAEQLAVLYPQGRVPVGNTEALRQIVKTLLTQPLILPAAIEAPFTQSAMTEAVIDIYEGVAGQP